MYSRADAPWQHERPHSRMHRAKEVIGRALRFGRPHNATSGKGKGKGQGEERDRKDPAVKYRQIFGISRTVKIEFVGVWVGRHLPCVIRSKLIARTLCLATVRIGIPSRSMHAVPS